MRFRRVPDVTIANRTAAYSRTYRLGRWSLNSNSVKPVRKGKGKRGTALGSIRLNAGSAF